MTSQASASALIPATSRLTESSPTNQGPGTRPTYTHTHIFTHWFSESCSDCTAGCLHWLCDFLRLFFTSFKSWSRHSETSERILTVVMPTDKRGAWCSEQPSGCRRRNTASAYKTCLEDETVKKFSNWQKNLPTHSDWWEWRKRNSMQEGRLLSLA